MLDIRGEISRVGESIGKVGQFPTHAGLSLHLSFRYSFNHLRERRWQYGSNAFMRAPTQIVVPRESLENPILWEKVADSKTACREAAWDHELWVIFTPFDALWTSESEDKGMTNGIKVQDQKRLTGGFAQVRHKHRYRRMQYLRRVRQAAGSLAAMVAWWFGC